MNSKQKKTLNMSMTATGLLVISFLLCLASVNASNKGIEAWCAIMSMFTGVVGIIVGFATTIQHGGTD